MGQIEALGRASYNKTISPPMNSSV